MASQNAIASLTQNTRDSLVQSHLQNAALVFLVYDSFLTFSDEVEFVWKQDQFKLAPTLFYTGRYFGLLAFVVPVAVGSGSTHCTALMRFAGAAFIIAQSAMTAFVLLRAYNISQTSRRWLILIILSILGIGALVPEIWSVGTYSCSSVPFHRSFYLKNIYAHGLSLLFETVALGVIVGFLYKPYVRNLKNRYLRLNTVTGFLLHDAVSSYMLIFLFNIFFILMYFLADPLLITVEAEISQPISIVLSCHFLLEIRQFSLPSSANSRVSTMSLDDFGDLELQTLTMVDPIYPQTTDDEDEPAKLERWHSIRRNDGNSEVDLTDAHSTSVTSSNSQNRDIRAGKKTVMESVPHKNGSMELRVDVADIKKESTRGISVIEVDTIIIPNTRESDIKSLQVPNRHQGGTDRLQLPAGDHTEVDLGDIQWLTRDIESDGIWPTVLKD